MAEFLIELLLEFFGEFLLGAVIELLAEVGLHAFKRPFQEKPSRLFAWIGYIVLGAAAGGLSLLVFPELFMRTHAGRIGYLLLAPVAVGLTMCLVGALRERKRQELIRLDKFGYGYLFALSLAAVRFAFGQ
ncbi:hypothetical protein [Ramlibacter albus]|uniref:Uncharacterized protein n=1 Tax=Ramlibacter albus TaxID=2079448 RepID=A0A923MFT1_9BURK|nr:hypothetical protein [Ramlibacter albus]MBC5768464.1 hypothetical protein [Ramlibacter albus]